MAWFRMDDGVTFHRKTLAAGNEAFGAWARMGTHSSAQLADGFIDEPAALLIAGRKAVIERLLTVAFLERVEGGYLIHDFLDYNPTAAEVLKTREARSEAGKRGGSKSAASRAKQTGSKPEAKGEAIASVGASTSAEANGKQSSTPARPGPYPSHPQPPPKPPPPLTPPPPAADPAPRPAPLLDAIDGFKVNGGDALANLRALSGGVIRASGGAVQWVKFGDHLGDLQRQHKRRDLVELLAAFAIAGGFAWLEKRLPTTDWFLENDGAQLTRCVEDAVEWERNGRKPIAKPKPKRTGIAPPAPASEFAEATRLGTGVAVGMDEITAAMARKRAQGG